MEIQLTRNPLFEVEISVAEGIWIWWPKLREANSG
jgi:hypothetical protein